MKKQLNENEINFLEQRIPELAETATKQAYFSALASGSSVMVAQEGNLILISPNGSKEIVGIIEKPFKLVEKKIKIPS